MKLTERIVVRFLLGVCLFAVIVLGVSVLVLWNKAQSEHRALVREVARNGVIARQSQRAQCLSKADRVRDLAAARRFLHDHPHGTADFSQAFVEMTIRQDKAILHNLKDVHCTKDQLRH